MRAIILFAALLVATDTGKTWEKEPHDYRGVPFGNSQEEVKRALPDLRCFPADARGSASCGSWNTFKIADVPVRQYLSFDDAGKFVAVQLIFSSDSYDKLRDVFVEKFGEPHRTEHVPVQTKAGSVFQNESLWWESDHMLASLDRYSDTVDESSAIFGVHSWVDAQLQRAKEKRKKAATTF